MSLAGAAQISEREAARAPFEILEPDSERLSALVFASPHSGQDYSAEFRALSRLDLPTLRRSEDSFVDEIFQAVRSIRATGVTVLIVEQRIAECLDIADRAYILQTGRVLMQGKAAEIKVNPDVRKAYLGL